MWLFSAQWTEYRQGLKNFLNSSIITEESTTSSTFWGAASYINKYYTIGKIKYVSFKAVSVHFSISEEHMHLKNQLLPDFFLLLSNIVQSFSYDPKQIWESLKKTNTVLKIYISKDVLKKKALQSLHYVSLDHKKPFPELFWLTFYSHGERLMQASSATTKNSHLSFQHQLSAWILTIFFPDLT